MRIYNYVTDDSGRNYQNCGTGSSAKAYWLDQDPNMSDYMILNNVNAHWLFTVTLSGCDIFIAVNTSKRGEPLVIHANQDRFKTQHQQNFEAKQTNTDNILRQHAGLFMCLFHYNMVHKLFFSITVYLINIQPK